MAVRQISLDSRDFAINYKIIDNKRDCWVLFLHGWGANKELMEGAFGGRFKSLNHLYVDLPGFGGSSNESMLDSADYGRIISTFLDSLKIVPQDSPQKDSPNLPALVLLSSAGLQKKQSNKVRLKIKFAKIARIFHLKAGFLISNDAKGLSQNMYETFKRVVREDFTQEFANLRAKTLIFWGKDDEALPLYVGEKMSDLIKDSRFFALNGNHFFFLDAQNAETIEKITTKELGL